MKFECIKIWTMLNAVLLALMCSVAQAQTPIGAFDQVFSNSAAFGWACLPGDAQTKVNVWYGLYDGANWAYYTYAPADKQRNDIGRSGACGPATGDVESYYHGFEIPVLSLDGLPKNKNYGLYAWVYTNTYPYYQFLSGGGGINTGESGLPTSQIWRTDYDDPYLRQPALISCIWPFHGANQRVNTSSIPVNPFTQNTVGGGATPSGATSNGNGTATAGPFGSVGFDTPNTFCINYPANTTIPAPWAAANSAAGSPSGSMWPTASNGYPSWPGYNY